MPFGRPRLASSSREMPVERLKDATRGRLRIGALTDAGITTVQQVLDHGARISIPSRRR